MMSEGGVRTVYKWKQVIVPAGKTKPLPCHVMGRASNWPGDRALKHFRNMADLYFDGAAADVDDCDIMVVVEDTGPDINEYGEVAP